MSGNLTPLPSLNALRAFEAMARTGAATRAARELGVTHGAVSRQVKALEAALGVRLFQGPRHRLELTEAGRALAVELARYKITENSILPGWIETEMTESAFNDPRFHGNVMPRMPMRRWGRPDDFGGIAVYLMSDASAFHTAQSFLIDGGYWVF